MGLDRDPDEFIAEKLEGLKNSSEPFTYRTTKFFYDILDKPVSRFRELVERSRALREPYYYYHPKFQRVPMVDECKTNDTVCVYEATEQMHRDRMVDEMVVHHLQKRYELCKYENESSYHREYCQPFKDNWDKHKLIYHKKWGNISHATNAIGILMKQKSRMIKEAQRGSE